jgi:UDP-N-acetylmuramoyl-L-alanyl-D-glutamate--2,6-diaminopimelate ligase
MGLQLIPDPPAAARWLAARGAVALASDSRKLRPGAAFIAWPGQVHDARAHVAEALAAAAPACLVESDGIERFGLADDPRLAAYAGLKAGCGPIASRFLGEPSHQLRVIACTGTNGKTSSAWWIAQAMARLGRRCGMVGTLGIGEPPVAGGPATPPWHGDGLTTPDPVVLQGALREFLDAGCAAVALEASSIGIAEERLAGTRIEVALYTNFSQDHLDYHGDMEAYWAAKERLFAWPGLRAAIVNVDDVHGLGLADRLAGSALELWTCATGHEARLRALRIRHAGSGVAFDVQEAGGACAAVETRIVGHFNVSNLIGVIGVLRACGVPLEAAAAACAGLTPVPGRLQPVGSGTGAPLVVVDYAHSPDALDKALAALRPVAAARGGRLWCVFGCGGNRDAAKRPLMGAIACRLADHVVVTSDNPRAEPPDFIISQVLAGVVGHDEVDVIEKRSEAVRHAIVDAAADDVVLLAGKGHEDYQEVAGVRHPYSDVEQAEAALRLRGPQS